MNNKVSIVVPLFNMEDLIGKCLDSLIRQTYKNIEIVIIDDGSSDKSGEIADTYTSKDERIKVVHHEKNKGIACGFLTGISNSTGDYLVFVDSDNYVSEQFIEVLLEIKEKTQCDMVQCNALCYTEESEVDNFQEKERELVVLKGKDDIIQDFLFKKNITNNMSCKLFPRDWFKDIRIPEGRQVVDIIVMLQAVDKCHSYACVSDSLYLAYMAPNSISRAEVSERRLSDLLFSDDFYSSFIKDRWPGYSNYTNFRTASQALWAYNSVNYSSQIKEKDSYLKLFNQKFNDNYKIAVNTPYYKQLSGAGKLQWIIFHNCPSLYNLALRIKK